MRFESRFADRAATLRCEPRVIERPDRLVEVLAPEGWSDARVEAALDWADGLPRDWPNLTPDSLTAADEAGPLAGGPRRWANRLAAWGYAMGAFEDVREAETFAAELAAGVLLGALAPGRGLAEGCRLHPVADDAPAPAAEPQLVDLADPTAEAAIAAHIAAARGARLAQSALDALHARLDAVREAVTRCEGPADACADPSRNPALARAMVRAREAGASDAVILAALDGPARPRPLAETAPPRDLAVLLARDLAASGAPQTALLADAA